MVAYVLNHVPSKSMSATSYELFMVESPFWNICAPGVRLVMYTTQPTNMENMV